MPKRGGRAGKSSGPTKDTEGDHIVFGDAKSAKKTADTRKQKGKNEETSAQISSSTEAAKPDTRTLIGGASWTGKLPVNILSEHCQKQKWQKPEYSMHQSAEGFSSMVTLSTKDPKTQEMTKLPPFKLPPHLKHLAIQPTAVEARHFAATYGLFRVCSMKNIHMMLPPTHKDVWKKQFKELKDADVKDGKAWMYEANPFLAQEERTQAVATMAKKREEAAKRRAAQAETPQVSLVAPGGSSGPRVSAKGWSKAPKVEMGKQMRNEIENIVRGDTTWNQYGIEVSRTDKEAIAADLARLGFRKRHTLEAMDECASREEALEWLLVHAPEDDQPKWAFPEGYTAGVTMASGNLKKEAILKRLADAGYSPEICLETLDACDGEETLAAERLQDLLMHQDDVNTASQTFADLGLDDADAFDVWKDEQETLESIYGPRYHRISNEHIEIELEVQHNGNAILCTIRKSRSYPLRPPVIAVGNSNLPKYVRLSIIRETIAFAMADLSNAPMVFSICDWLESNILRIIEEPGTLKSLSAAISNVASSDPVSRPQRSDVVRQKPRSINWTRGTPQSRILLDRWKARQDLPAQKKMLASRQSLPAWRLRDEIVQAVSVNQVTIIAGETGSGKSTQAVQFLLDDMIMAQVGAAGNIVCTQPRRISALGLADRVSAERCSIVGDEVGYAIKGETKHSSNTKISFVTTGVLLRRLQTSGGTKADMVRSLADVSHVIVDEVHERSLDTDFLLVLLRDILRERPDLKLILMSATLDADIFRRYFGQVGMITVAGRTFPIEDYYLDDIIRLTGISSQDTKTSADSNQSTSQAIQSLGMGINYELIKELVHAIDFDLGSAVSGGVLIFMPGMLEINRTLDALRNMQNIYALPLHASLTPSEQRRVFPPAPLGKRKIIVATNVAETSITIEDIVAVIDSGKVKETSFDPQSNVVKLQEVWASRAACKQRRGRAGRVREGQCYKLYTKNAEAKMAERAEPEIKRVPLEQLCLSVKAMGIADPTAFLALAITPPESAAVQGAVHLLGRIGAIQDGRLTALGRHLSMIPADLRCSKLMVYGATFGCLEACVTIAAILTARSPFLSPQTKREESKAARVSFSSGQGDLIADLRAFEAYSERKRTCSFRDLRYWCDELFLSNQTLNDIGANRTQYLSSLRDIGFLSASYNQHSPSSHPLNAQNENTALIRALVAGSFSPQIARIDFPDTKYAPSISGAVALDPEARTIKYFNEENGRVFTHPSSTLFGAQIFPSQSAFLSYFSKMETSKVFVREITPFNVYSLLMFGGNIELDVEGRGLLVDEWIRVKGWARIGVLVRRLRAMLDRVLSEKVEDPGRDVSGREVVRIVRKLVELDGLDR